MSNDFQTYTIKWAQECFPKEHIAGKPTRNAHFLEEAIELVQATGMLRLEAHKLVDQVFNKPTGKTPQEVGGVMVTLALLCEANNLQMQECADRELQRIWDTNTMIEIRNKQKHKPH
jgi:hypothetical protein